MESIVFLRSALNTTLPSKSPAQLLSFSHPPVRHLAVVSHLSVPRSGPRLHHSVSCSSHVPPPPALPQGTPRRDDVVDRKKDRAEERKGPRTAAACAALIVACALGAVYMSRGPPVAAVPVPQSQSPQIPMEEKGKTTVQETLRDEVYEILFKKKVLKGYSKDRSPEETYEGKFPLIETLLDWRHYHEAKAVCEKIKLNKAIALPNDARPPLLMAVINMMLAVEAMLSPKPDREDVVKYLIERATDSWNEYRDLEEKGFVSGPWTVS